MESLKKIETQLHDFLLKNYKNLSSYKNSYGLTFTSLCLKETPEAIDFCMQEYQKLDFTSKNFHHEFNNYALIHLVTTFKHSQYTPLISSLSYSKNTTTNWTLLRLLCKYKMNPQKGIIESVFDILQERQTPEGCIQDTPWDTSLQYHCFSNALLGELYELTKNERFLKYFLSWVNFIQNFILPNWQSLYIGRGQEQIFWYGSLIYILSLAFSLTQDESYLSSLSKVKEYVSSFIRVDGSIPLVLRKEETSIPTSINLNNKFLWWYNYNNYYDYFPFLLYYIQKSNLLLQEIKMSDGVGQEKDFQDSNVQIVHKKKYISVISKPLGAIYNCIPLPLIFSKEKNILVTPFYGGEQYGTSLYKKASLPLPYGKVWIMQIGYFQSLKDKVKYFIGNTQDTLYFFHDTLKYSITSQGLFWENEHFSHKRDIHYWENEIYIQDTILFKKDVRFQRFFGFCFLSKEIIQLGKNKYTIDAGTIEIEWDVEILFDEEIFYNALSPLKRIYACEKNIKKKAWEIYSVKYTIKI